MGYVARPKPFEDRKAARVEVASPVTRKWFNLVGCVLASSLYFYLLIVSNHLWTIDTGLSIFLAEYCGWSNARKRKRTALRNENNTHVLSAKRSDRQYEKSFAADRNLDCLAAVVGYREDPAIFTKALQSYITADNCRFVLACVDGDGDEDQEMVNVFSKVYKTDSTLLHLQVPLVEIALSMDRMRSKDTPDDDILDKCCTIAKRILEEKNIRLTGEGAISRLCISQPHMHKKGVMFTSFIFSKVISDALGIEYLWTSDSDSIVLRNTISRTVATIAGDPLVAGASTALSIHNRNDTLITKIGNSVYLNELHLSRCFASSFGANDCQSGPCAVFRTALIIPELLAWYKQTVLGHRMIVNEDRHLTTRLLLKGWRILFIPDAFTATESPINMRRWLLQQVRWARAVHIESYSRPEIYLQQPPIFFFAALRRQLTGMTAMVIAMVYLFTGVTPLHFSFQDYLFRFAFTLVYLAVRNPLRPSLAEWLYSVPANLFYNVPLPAVQAWSLMTVFNDSWGTTMRSSKELSRHSKLRAKMWDVGFFVFWIGLLGGVAGRYVASSLMLGPAHIMGYMFVGTTTVWSILGYWMVVCD
ncbi:hyaluronan synthase [Pseudovirgaria hyperparasitica]|uniref:Hyaluronan synthase n=1 Tax=Pseudovirgaria hyperparasitica TaxID=470096 RepID=A0A6A6WB54_9PEZI|nr:hyaluronan synthase [Pseudovirgaria hyperparasitica]KAF2758837.1 hyaluronan synthase [Pseudovirgaria hyperparasitica]